MRSESSSHSRGASTSCGATYRATKVATTKKARVEQKATLQEAMELNESLAQQISAKLERMDGFRAKLLHDARRCRELLAELE